jgi:hypothetical protein
VYRYVVWTEDNFHHMEPDSDNLYKHGEFDTCEEAIAAAKHVVDEFLLTTLEPEHTAEELWKLFTTFGDSAYITTDDPACRRIFSSWEYARTRSHELTGSKVE